MRPRSKETPPRHRKPRPWPIPHGRSVIPLQAQDSRPLMAWRRVGLDIVLELVLARNRIQCRAPLSDDKARAWSTASPCATGARRPGGAERAHRPAYCAGSRISQRTLSIAASNSGASVVPQASRSSSSCATLVTPMIVLATRQLP